MVADNGMIYLKIYARILKAHSHSVSGGSI